MGTTERLSQIVGFYQREARKCSRGGAYFSSCVMQVAALEASLQGVCTLYSREVKKTSVYQRKRFRTKRNRVLEFSLNELIKIADERNWFPAKRFTWAGKRATIAGFAHEIREVRNYVHPGKWAREHPSTTRPTKGWDRVVSEVCATANSWLLHKMGY
jgi:hypothetical protein